MKNFIFKFFGGLREGGRLCNRASVSPPLDRGGILVARPITTHI